jgi:O-antigen/teichoic acid export membrane protein
MLRNALFLTVNSGVSAGLGFAFWIITARLFSTETVGLASSLTSASNLIVFLGLVGLNTTFVRYLPMAKYRDRLITAGVSLVTVVGGALALVCVVLLPLISPPLSFVTHSLPLAVGFVLLTAGAGINLLTDSVFIAAGKSQYNILIDGVIGGGTKIILVIVLAGAGAYGVFGAASGGFVASAAASLFLMIKVLHWRPEFKNFRQVLKPVLAFSGTSYAGNVLALLPILVVPLIILARIGASDEAYYYVSYQLATLLYQAVYAVEQSFLSEGAGADVINRAFLMRSVRILAALCIPAFILVVLFGHQLLAAFGPKYASHTGNMLIVLSVAVFPIAASNWCMTVLRLLTNKLRAIVWACAVSDVVIIGLAWVWAPRGVEAVAMAWPLGCTAGFLVIVVPAVKALRRSRSTRQHHPALPLPAPALPGIAPSMERPARGDLDDARPQRENTVVVRAGLGAGTPRLQAALADQHGERLVEFLADRPPSSDADEKRKGGRGEEAGTAQARVVARRADCRRSRNSALAMIT